MSHFYKLQYTDDRIDLLKSEIESRSDWFENKGFSILRLHKHIFSNTPVGIIIDKFKGSPVIFRLNPMTWYNWHTDTVRQCAINMLINGEDSKTFFGNKVSTDLVELTELNYESQRYYLFNTQKNHAILNLNNFRYVLSIGFNPPNTFDNILNFFQENNL